MVIEVRDDGPGIPPEERARVLDRFYRGSHQGQPGSGLGLSIVKRIADQHGAVVSLDAGAEEKGLLVRVMFTINSYRDTTSLTDAFSVPYRGRGRAPVQQ